MGNSCFQSKNSTGTSDCSTPSEISIHSPQTYIFKALSFQSEKKIQTEGIFNQKNALLMQFQTFQTIGISNDSQRDSETDKKDDFTTNIESNEQKVEETLILNEKWLLQLKKKLSSRISQKKTDEETENSQFQDDYALDFPSASHEPSKEYAVPYDQNFEISFNQSKQRILSPKCLDPEVQIALKRIQPFQVYKKDFRKALYFDKLYYIYNLNALYIGCWVFGKPNNYGKMYFQNGQIKEGFFKNGELHGPGRVISMNGTIFEGNFHNGKLDGQGVIIEPSGINFKGLLQDGVPDGFGEETWPNGFYLNGIKTGAGEMYWQSKQTQGQRYTGEFQNGLFHGRGTYMWHDGRMYEGEWSEGKMHGKGTFMWKDGRQYEGEYVNDQKEGEGIFTWPGEYKIINNLQETVIIPRKQWKGSWKGGQMHGRGELWEKGTCYRGEWKNGVLIKY